MVFRFRLEKVLQVRLAMERARAAKLAEAERYWRSQIQRLDQLRENRNTAAESMHRLMQDKGPDVTRLLNAGNYIRWMDEAMEQQEKQIEKAQMAVVEQRQALLKAALKRKTIQNLKGKLSEAHRRLALKRQLKMLDGLTIQSQARRQNHESNH